jgi:cytochrome c oxidase subunit 2
VIYHLPDGTDLESANELVIPVGERVALSLRTADVIHSFWVPNLAGKVDMIPGRTNRLALQATQAGVSRGQCAEYYGGAHALMLFQAVARERHEFDEWLRAESRPAVRTDGEGARLFVASESGACHRIRGLASAAGSLTHVASHGLRRLDPQQPAHQAGQPHAAVPHADRRRASCAVGLPRRAGMRAA